MSVTICRFGDMTEPDCVVRPFGSLHIVHGDDILAIGQGSLAGRSQIERHFVLYDGPEELRLVLGPQLHRRVQGYLPEGSLYAHDDLVAACIGCGMTNPARFVLNGTLSVEISTGKVNVRAVSQSVASKHPNVESRLQNVERALQSPGNALALDVQADPCGSAA